MQTSVSLEIIMSFTQKKDEAYFRTLLRTVESTPGLYYSYEADITLIYVILSVMYSRWHLIVSISLQRRYKLAEGWMNKSIWKQVSQRIRSIFKDKLSSEYNPYLLHLENVLNVIRFSFCS